MHKNKNLFNKWIFLDNYIETIEKDEENVPLKVMNIKNCLNVLEYKNNKVFIHLDAITKINTDLKIQYADIKISNIEIYDAVGLKNINLFEVKSHLFSMYKNFKSFMEVRKYIFKIKPTFNSFFKYFRILRI
jgi:glycerol-3-phosphate responsive antiterminator